MSPKTKEQYEEIRQQSKATIMEAALELFAQKGYASTSISDIARAANISKGLMYNYFKGKQQLLTEIIAQAVEEIEGVMLSSIALTTQANEQLIAIVEGSFQLVDSHRHHWRLLSSLAFQPEIVKEMEGTFPKKYEGIIQLLVNILIQLGVEDAEKEAYLMGAALDGLLLQYFFIGKEYPVEEMKALFIKRFCNY